MKCEVCGIGDLQEKRIDYSLLLDDKFVVVEHVPASVCDRCGESSFTPDVVDRLQQTLWRSHAPVKTLETPVYEFVAGDSAGIAFSARRPVTLSRRETPCAKSRPGSQRGVLR